MGNPLSRIMLACILLQICVITLGHNVEQSMIGNQIVSDVIDRAPRETAMVTFPSGGTANLGNILTAEQVSNQPTVRWNANPNALYTVCMVDPDAPSRQNPTSRSFDHWLVGNIPGNNIAGGEVLSGYIGSQPPQGTGLHRYVILVYRQNRRLTFTEPRIPNTSGDNRANFSIRNFARKYELGDPVAGNFYQTGFGVLPTPSRGWNHNHKG